MRATALVALSLTGCFDFEEKAEVKDLRILAVTVEPPEVFVTFELNDAAEDEDATIYTVTTDPAPVQISTLVVDPRFPTKPLKFDVDACLWVNERRCDEWPAEDRMEVVRDGTGRPETLSFEFAPKKEMVNRWVAADSLEGYGGLFVMLDIRIDDGNEVVRAAKIVTYNLPFVPKASDQDPPPPKVPNKNPVLDGLRFEESDTLGPDARLQVPRGEEIDLVPLFDREVHTEEYPVPTFPDQETGEVGYRVLTEKLQLELYATAGDFDQDELESRNPTGEVEEIETAWTPPDDPEVKSVTMWVVFRDDRGGGSWVRRVIDLK